jgi:phage terminase large subunit GpA-like protein
MQADRIAIELVAWGNNFETWTMGYWQLLGDTGGNKVWDELTEFFHKVRILDENGTPCEIDKIAIDAGFNTQNVKRWVVRNSNVIPVIGRAKRNAIISLPSIEETRKDKKDKAYGVKSYLVGVDKIKEELTGFLNQEIFEEDGDRLIPFGYCHFHESCTDAYFQEITSEHQVKKRVKGAEVYEWSVLPGRRNEALDCRIYARAAAYHLGYDRMSLGMMQRMKPEKKEKSKALWSRKDIK